MSPKSIIKSGRAKRMALLAGALFLVLLVSSSQVALPALAASLQESDEFTLVNEDEEFVKRHDDGYFEAKPIFSAEPEWLAYAIKDPVDGEWLTNYYYAQDDPDEKDRGWEYDIDYPEYDEQIELDPGKFYTLGLYARYDEEDYLYEVTIPAHEGSGLWDRVLNALNPARWAKAIAGWMVEGVHGILCSVLSKITGSDPANC